jgi:hypothetical protein
VFAIYTSDKIPTRELLEVGENLSHGDLRAEQKKIMSIKRLVRGWWCGCTVQRSKGDGTVYINLPIIRRNQRALQSGPNQFSSENPIDSPFSKSLHKRETSYSDYPVLHNVFHPGALYGTTHHMESSGFAHTC